ncbi:MAG TPA: histidinol-phosphatase [Caulobacteraceae bacterium]|jgi:histidinol phosphatase-like enzyme (inositol monophosphatase family)|nr:histidinol-phosphatase [Caulobacteraceae bacterium]
MHSEPADFTELEAFAVDLARAAGEVILPLFRADIDSENKARAGERYDPVTAADRASESVIRKRIGERYPEHGVLGEEFGADRTDQEFVWVIDPIDGTRAFMAGLPLWTTLIALRHRGQPIIGLIAQPYLGEVFVGGPNGSRLLKGDAETRLRTRACPLLTDAVIATTDPNLFDGAETGAFAQVRAAARLARFGCDAYAYAMVAMGRIDLVIESGLKAWDYEPLIPVVEGAGGYVRNWRGDDVDGSGQIVAAGDARCLDEALTSLRRSALRQSAS